MGTVGDWVWQPDIEYPLKFVWNSALGEIAVVRPPARRGLRHKTIDSIPTRAHTTAGRIRACRRWMYDHREWEQLVLPRIGDASA